MHRILLSTLVFILCQPLFGQETETEKKINAGRKLFESSCAACHSFERHGIGPSLAGLTKKQTTQQILDFISNPQKVIDSGNDRAVKLLKKYKTVMPSYSNLGKENIENIISYIDIYRDLPQPLDFDEEGILEDPIPQKIEKSDFLVNLELVLQIPASNESVPHTRITKLSSHPNNQDICVLDINGKLYRINGEKPEVYMDMQALMPNFKQSPGWATGFGSYAFHPDFQNNGLLYTTHAEPKDTQKADFDLPDECPVTLQWVIQEWKTNSPNSYPFKGTYRELLRIDMVSQTHGVQNIDFNPTAAKGDPDYGNLYIGIGDGGAVEKSFLDVANGKHSPWASILRIDPSGNNSENGMYGIPIDNPFVHITDEKVAKEVYANGFRNPHRFTWNKEGKMICANIGQHNIESVYVVHPGANHGWPIREGGFGINTQESVRKIFRLSEDEKNDGITYPSLSYDHDEGNAVCGGFVYAGLGMPSLSGSYIFGDILKGRLFYADESQMQAGKAIDFKELRIALDGQETTLLELTNSGHAKLRLGQDNNGDIYLFSMNDGKLYRMVSETSI